MQRIRKYTRWTKFLLFTWAILFLTSNLPGRIEGAIFPVIDNLEISVLNKTPYSNVMGSYEKMRTCDLEEIRWYIIGSNGYKVRIKTDEITVDERFFSPGRQSFGPIEVKMSPDFLVKNSEVHLISNCHPFWDTLTVIYP